MVFSSYLFLFFFLPAVLLYYYMSPRKWKHLVLTLFCYLFYGWANPYFCLLMAFNTMVDYTNGLMMEKYPARKNFSSRSPSFATSPFSASSNTSISELKTTMR